MDTKVGTSRVMLLCSVRAVCLLSFADVACCVCVCECAEGGQLTEAVRRRPYQVILLDEAEKAHREGECMILFCCVLLCLR